MKSYKNLLSIAAVVFSLTAHAKHHGSGNNNGGGNQQPPPPSTSNGAVPECMDKGAALNVDNAEVLKMETTTANQFLSRGHVQGTVEQMFPDATGHRHFSLKIGPNPGDHIEIIYNLSFGEMPVKVGDNVEACGDYITSNAPSGGYKASPDGALLHWVHKSTSSHDQGFVIVNGQLYGQGSGSGN